MVALAENNPVVVNLDGAFSGRMLTDWCERFLRACDLELQEWLDAVTDGTANAPSARNGYAATVVSDTALEALGTGVRTTVSMRERPDFYQTNQQVDQIVLAPS